MATATNFQPDEQGSRSWANSWRNNDDEAFDDDDEEEEDTSNVLDITGIWSISMPPYSERFGIDGPFTLQLFSSRPNRRSYCLWAQFDFSAFKGLFKFVEGQRPGTARMLFEWRGEDTYMETHLPEDHLRGWIEFLEEDELRGHIEGTDLGRFDFEGRKVLKLAAAVDHATILSTWEEYKGEATPEDLAVRFGALGRFGLSN